MKSTVTSSGSRGEVPPSFRERLQAELVRRCRDNAQYSLRAFALDLAIDHASLSQLLRGRRGLTSAMIERLGARLGLATDEIEAYVRRERLVVPVPEDDATIVELRTLSRYAAAVVDEWEHFAILELTHVEGFRPDVAWIARVLGVPNDSIVVAVNRLMYLGLLVMRDERTWVDTSTTLLARTSGDSARDHHLATMRGLIERLNALAASCEGSDMRARDHSSTTLAVSSRRLPEAIELIRAQRRDLVALLERDEPRDEVYRLETHLFPITRHSPRS